MSEHLDRRTVQRKGWFQKGNKKKGEVNKPIPNYVTSCKNGGRGYLGPRFEAHHVIPQTSIELSIVGSGKDQRYISDVQYITDWNINGDVNMMGLPHYHAYHLYYQGKTRMSSETGSEHEGGLVSWFNNQYALKSRKRWLSEVQTVPPEPYPIHTPAGRWGHVEYNDEVIQELKQNVWDKINDQKKDHQLDAKTVAAELDGVADMNYDYLVARGAGANQAKWDRRTDPNDNGWHKPFTMMDVSNPFFG